MNMQGMWCLFRRTICKKIGENKARIGVMLPFDMLVKIVAMHKLIIQIVRK